jgi:hypothetical protein
MKYIVYKFGSYRVENTSGFKPDGYVAAYTGQVPESDMPYTTITDGALDEMGVPTKVFTVDTVARDAALSIDTKTSDLEALRAARDVDIYAELKLVFLTMDPNSANAYYETWQDMALNPSEYIAFSLVCPELLLSADATTLFALGAALDTNLKIQQYAGRKIEQALTYGRWRMGRLTQYAVAKAVIENA